MTHIINKILTILAKEEASPTHYEWDISDMSRKGCKALKGEIFSLVLIADKRGIAPSHTRGGFPEAFEGLYHEIHKALYCLDYPEEKFYFWDEEEERERVFVRNNEPFLLDTENNILAMARELRERFGF